MRRNALPIYELQIRGDDKIRLVKAATSAQARDHIVSAKPIGAERMAELTETGVKLEKIANPADPASHAEGGELHDSGQGGGEGGENGGGEGDPPAGDPPAGEGEGEAPAGKTGKGGAKP